jgi:acetyl-CoA/propionyl-CoA carboxylase, biotin carboxylase, biotin carboxyl carrier protein
MIYEVREGSNALQVEVKSDNSGAWFVSVDGGPVRRWTGRSVGRAEWFLAADHRARALGLSVDGDRVHLQRGGASLTVEVVDPRRAALDQLGGAAQGTVVTQMPGIIVRVPVAVGGRVVVGQVVCVVEAMKMENEFKAPVAGVVASVGVEAGVAVESGTVLLVIAEDE